MERSFDRLSIAVGLSVSTVASYAKRNGWLKRIAAYDAACAELSDARSVFEKLDAANRHAKLAKGMVGKVTE